jgi:uncharacterized protein
MKSINAIQKRRVMSPETLKETIDFFCSQQKKIEFIWHGGEPMLAGICFYQKAVEFQKAWIDKGRTVANFFQTNGTLLNDNWTKFFVDNNFLVGTSLDGPKHIHDQVRVFKNGKGTFDKVMNGIKILQEAKIFNGVICCVSSFNKNMANEIFDFFVSQKILSMKFLQVKDVNGIYVQSISYNEFTNFLISIFHKWLAVDNPEIEIRDIKSIVNIMLGGKFKECTRLGRCDQFSTIYNDGKIYGCDVLPKTTCFNFGNVKESPNYVRTNKKMLKIKKIIETRKKECGECEWFYVCRGGCLKCYSFETKESPTDYCLALKRLYAEIYATLKEYNLVDNR